MSLSMEKWPTDAIKKSVRKEISALRDSVVNSGRVSVSYEATVRKRLFSVFSEEEALIIWNEYASTLPNS